jgi:MscS family membrane protein
MLYMFFGTPDWATELRERHRLAVDIVRLAHELGIEFAFPTRTVFLRQEEWQADQLAGADYPEVSEQMVADARRRARRMVDQTLAGERPGPVDFGPADGQPDRDTTV